MILMFRKGTDNALIKVSGHSLNFSKVMGSRLITTTIEGLRFDVRGCLLEFPDLEGLPDTEIIKQGKQRFKEHIKKMQTEKEISEYITEDLGKHGYRLQYFQRAGFRPVKCQ